MTIKEFKELVKDLPDNTIIVLSSDEEGNEFHEAGGYSKGRNYRNGEIGLSKLTPEFEEKGYSQEDVMRGGKPCIVLWPE